MPTADPTRCQCGRDINHPNACSQRPAMAKPAEPGRLPERLEKLIGDFRNFHDPCESQECYWIVELRAGSWS